MLRALQRDGGMRGVDAARAHVLGEGRGRGDCVSSDGCGAPFRVWPLTNRTAQLFNLTSDPWERVDVAAQYPDVVAQLVDRLAASPRHRA